MQSVPKIAYGPAKKKIVPAKKMPKNITTPMKNSPNKQAPLFYFLDMPFIDPVNPATPSNKNKIADRYNAINEPVTAD